DYYCCTWHGKSKTWVF
nr:immunoglobulin light chain junction region [Macaca mulatta]MOX69526.1 immunoglobulin light chain junction region [Macaca mulatta]MOX69800.1 immunoglobulin light chain junction region [Macaca mulatta]MOX70469.1 immunoglobulin light chain junction region [Macaca mulatta]MOX70548.1 immunoglobulin light chain junction region [Macaca mulatta]